MGIYNVSKHAVVSLTETLYQDLAWSRPDQRQRAVLFVPTGIAHERNRPSHLAAQPRRPARDEP